MEETTRILVMYAMEYRIEDGGSINEGCSIQYYFYGQNGEALARQDSPKGSIGYQRAKCSVDIGARSKVVQAPAIYDAMFAMRVGSDGRPVLTITDLKYVAPVDFVLHKAARPADPAAK